MESGEFSEQPAQPVIQKTLPAEEGRERFRSVRQGPPQTADGAAD